METEFTPWQALAGGGLIGLASVMLMLLLGRIMGATGIVAGVMSPVSAPDFSWRIALLAGMMTAPFLMYVITGGMPEIEVPVPVPMMAIGGLIVGVGVTLGSGCTSGHGVCGIARLSPRSIAATAMFMATTAITVFVVRHVAGV